MGYQTANIGNLKAGEAGYQLTSDPGNGLYIAALWSVTRLANQALNCQWTLRQVDVEGKPVADAGGKPVHTVVTEQLFPADVMASGGIEAVKQQLLDIGMGEPSAVRDLPDDVRDAIQAASMVT